MTGTARGDFSLSALFFILPSDKVLDAVDLLYGALFDLLGDPVAELVVPGHSAVAHPHLEVGIDS